MGLGGRAAWAAAGAVSAVVVVLAAAAALGAAVQGVRLPDVPVGTPPPRGDGGRGEDEGLLAGTPPPRPEVSDGGWVVLVVVAVVLIAVVVALVVRRWRSSTGTGAGGDVVVGAGAGGTAAVARELAGVAGRRGRMVGGQDGRAEVVRAWWQLLDAVDAGRARELSPRGQELLLVDAFGPVAAPVLRRLRAAYEQAAFGTGAFPARVRQDAVVCLRVLADLEPSDPVGAGGVERSG